MYTMPHHPDKLMYLLRKTGEQVVTIIYPECSTDVIGGAVDVIKVIK